MSNLNHTSKFFFQLSEKVSRQEVETSIADFIQEHVPRVRTVFILPQILPKHYCSLFNRIQLLQILR